jgi:hypothetical protein
MAKVNRRPMDAASASNVEFILRVAEIDPRNLAVIHNAILAVNQENESLKPTEACSDTENTSPSARGIGRRPSNDHQERAGSENGRPRPEPRSSVKQRSSKA